MAPLANFRSKTLGRRDATKDWDKILKTLDKVDKSNSVVDDSAEYLPGNISLLHAAVRANRIDVVMALLRLQVNIETKDIDGCEPLMVAAKAGAVEICSVLLEVGEASLETVASEEPYVGWTPLHFAASSAPNTSRWVGTVMLKKLTEVDFLDAKGRTPLHVAAEHGNFKACKELVKSGADVVARTLDGKTPCELAALKGNRCCVEILRSVRPSAVPDLALHAAAAKDRILMLQFLLKECCLDVNAVDRDGNTALHIAASRGCEESLQLLLEAGADTCISNERGQLASDLVGAFAESRANHRFFKEPKPVVLGLGHHAATEVRKRNLNDLDCKRRLDVKQFGESLMRSSMDFRKSFSRLWPANASRSVASSQSAVTDL